MAKCQEFIKYVNKTATKKGLTVAVLSCVNGSTSDICMTFIKDNKADLVTLDGGRVYEAGTRLVCQVLEKFLGLDPVEQRKKKNVGLCSCTPKRAHEIRKFHVGVVQRQLRNVQKT